MLLKICLRCAYLCKENFLVHFHIKKNTPSGGWDLGKELNAVEQGVEERCQDSLADSGRQMGLILVVLP